MTSSNASTSPEQIEGPPDYDPADDLRYARDRRTRELKAALTEVKRLRDGIRKASECDEPLMTGGTDQPARVVGPCGTCRGCTVRQRTHGLLDDRTETR